MRAEEDPLAMTGDKRNDGGYLVFEAHNKPGRAGAVLDDCCARALARSLVHLWPDVFPSKEQRA